eukprot:8918672-Pyramimonas_sp.AAC.1
MHSPSHDRDPEQCWWCDKNDYYWECPSCTKNCGRARPGHLRAPGTCKFTTPWELPDDRGQGHLAPAEPAAPPPAATAASDAPPPVAAA